MGLLNMVDRSAGRADIKSKPMAPHMEYISKLLYTAMVGKWGLAAPLAPQQTYRILQVFPLPSQPSASGVVVAGQGSIDWGVWAFLEPIIIVFVLDTPVNDTP